MTTQSTSRMLMELFDTLQDRFGPRNWWPAETPLEVMVGAVLTQNTAWRNVEKAIASLKETGMLDAHALHTTGNAELAALIRPAGYYNLKAVRLKNLMRFVVEECDGRLDKLFAQDPESLRGRLLAVKGVGPETADSILLYAGNLPSFVVDAYTLRILTRHGLVPEKSGYEATRRFFMDHLPPDARLYNEFHALLVSLGHHYCRRKPRCAPCPLGPNRAAAPPAT